MMEYDGVEDFESATFMRTKAGMQKEIHEQEEQEPWVSFVGEEESRIGEGDE